MSPIIVILLILILFGGLGGGYYVNRPGYNSGVGAGWGFPFGGIVSLILLVVLLRYLGIF